MRTIVETLAERVYAHGHAIGLSEAQEIGLPVEVAPDDLDAAMWDLLNEYEVDLKLLEPIDPSRAVGTNDLFTEEAVLAIVESASGAHEFTGQIEVKANRQMPQNLAVSVNIALQLPQGIDAAALPPAVQQALAQLIEQGQQALVQEATKAVQDALTKQARVVGYEAGFRGGLWKKSA